MEAALLALENRYRYMSDYILKGSKCMYVDPTLVLRAYPNNPVRYFSVRQRIVNRFVLRECCSCVPFPYKG